MLQIKDHEFKLIMGEKVSKAYKILDNDAEPFPEKIKVVLDGTLEQDVDIFLMPKYVNQTVIENSRIDIRYNGGDTPFKIHLFSNRSRELTIRNCIVNFTSDTQVGFCAIYNYGGVDTHLETQADNLAIEHCRIYASVKSQNWQYESVVCGVESVLANSISIAGNYIFAQTGGVGDKQKAFGILNSGRFARIENNNIKANGTHNKGFLLEAAHCYGVYNTGVYTIVSGNNCVAEWGGKCVGLFNGAEFCNITGNKILATHTICGRTVILAGEKNVLSNNVITNTSRNPRLIEIRSSYNIVKSNHIEGLMGEMFSGIGILVAGEEYGRVCSCAITDNSIYGVKDYGIALLNAEKCRLRDNAVFPSYGDMAAAIFHSGDHYLSGEDSFLNPAKEPSTFLSRNDEGNIVSLWE